MRVILTITLAVLIVASAVLADSQKSELVSWGSLKSSYAVPDRIVGQDRIVFVDPWPVPYTQDPSIDEVSAKRAMMRVGTFYLMTCTDVHVMSSTNAVAAGEVAMVSATRPTGLPAIWLVDLNADVVAREVTITSLDANSLSVLDETSNEVITSEMIDDAAQSDSAQDHLDSYGEIYDPDTVGTDGLWQKLKDKWNEMNHCEQAHLVGGILVCAPLGHPVAAVACGAGFWVSAALTC